MAELTIALNFVIIFLLVTAIIYGFILNKRINLIRESSKELSHLFRSFDDTILRAQKGIEDLKRVSGAISEGLQKKIDKAALLMDDLEFMREKATKAADDVGRVLDNIKNIGARQPEKANNNVVAMPLVISPPPVPGKSMVPPKVPSLFKNKKALEDMLWDGDEAAKKKTVVNNNSKNKNSKLQDEATSKEDDEQEKNEKKQFSIVSALKALGYGE